MYKTEIVRARIQPQLKDEVHSIFEKLGVTPTQVITMLYKQIQNKKALPFDLSLPAVEEDKKKKYK